MDPLSRRSFFAASAGAAGTVAILASPAGAATKARQGKSDDHESGRDDGDAGSSGVVVHVRDAEIGEVVIYAADSEIVVTDRKLVAAISRASNGKG